MKMLAAKALFKKTTLITAAFVLALSSVVAAVPFILSKEVSAASAHVYQGIPSVQSPNYVSLGYAATSTSEFGDLVQLSGSNRLLDDVVVSFSSWACQTGGWNTGNCTTTPGATFTHPVTVTLYKVGANGAVGDQIATKTQSITAKYRPSADPACTGTDAGKWRDSASGICSNGVAFDQTFDFSSQTKVLPSQIIIGIAYNTNTHGYAPLSTPGPYDSLNVSLPTAAPAAGTDVDSDVMYWNTTNGSFYTGGGVGGTFRTDSGWSPYHLGVNITADATPVTSACGPIETTWANSLTGWDLSQSRTQGSSTVVGGGLQIETWGAAGSPDQRKAAGYLPVDYALSANGSQTISESLIYNPVHGIAPGLQLVVDFDNDGSVDGILVGESTYGNSWWLASSALGGFVQTNSPNIGNGYGSQYYGTINEWLSKFPTAQVKAIGYSLGSGVTAKGVIKSITLGCERYRFDNVAPGIATHLTPVADVTIGTQDFWFDWSDVDGATRYEIQNSTNPATDLTTGSFQNVMWTGDYQQVQPTESKAHSVGANGTWYWQIRAIDGAGNKGAWTTPWKVTIDVEAPATPVVTLKTSGGTTLVNGGATNSLGVIADWADVAGASSYIYKYWNTIPGNPWTESNPYTVNVASSEQAGTFTEGQGTHYIQVFAKDEAGNVSAGSTPFEITYDIVPPTSTNDLPSVVTGTIQVTQTITDNFVAASGKLRIWKLVNGAQDNSQFYASANVAVDSNGKAVYLLESESSLFGDGEYIAKFTSTDKAGNASVSEKTFIVDNTAPTVTIAPLVAATSTPTISGTVGDNVAAVKVTINANEYNATIDGNTWSFTIPSPLADDDYEVSAVATDEHGNSSAPVLATLTIATSVSRVNTGGDTNSGTQNDTGGQPATIATVVPAITSPAAALGVATENTDNADGEVEGASTKNIIAEAVNSEANQGTWFGIGWYWWLLIIAGISGAAWWIISALRGRQA